MSKNLTFEYTIPSTGAQATKQCTIDIERYRRDTEEGAVENTFIKASGSGMSDILENVDDLIADLLDGRPSNPKRGVVQALVDTEFTADGTTLSVKPDADDQGFVAHVPCVLLDKYGNMIDWFIPTVVAADFTIPAGPTEEAALHQDAHIGWIVQQAQPFASSLGENSQLGIKAQAEKPATPAAGTCTPGTGKITVAWTRPSDVVIRYFDIYVIKAAICPTIIEPNDLASVADRPAASAVSGVELTEYFDEDTMELTVIDAGTYFVGFVAKDGLGNHKVNESAIGWSALVTVSV